MKNKIAVHTVISTVICLLMMAIFLAFSAKLPNSVPIHWDTHGNVSNSIPKPWLVFGFPVAYALVNLIAAASLVVKKEKGLWKLYIVPAVAIIVTIIVLYLGLK
ncbi:MAG: DUF1648 domain-containing protein [Clostridium sp.]|jgi:uncharacterized membrane protein|nr:DUF1648 domain-containing protein [Clostridium sp.]